MSRTGRVAASLLVPFLLHALLFVICQDLGLWSSEVMFFDVLPETIGTAVGYLLLVDMYRRYAVAIAIVYIPAMFAALCFSGLMLAGYIYGNYL